VGGLKNRLTKYKMAAAAILKNRLNDHNSVDIAYIYTKFGSGRKTDVLETEVPLNFKYLKIQDGGGRHFKNTKIVIIRPPFKIYSPNLVRR